MPTIPAPPPDASGGYMLIQYTNGQYTHRMRQHIMPFNSGFAYVAPRSGGEANVSATFAALCAKLAPYFTPSWTFTLLSLYQNNAGVVSLIPAPPSPAPVAGTLPTASATNQPEFELMFNFRSAGGGRARLVMVGCPALGVPGAPVFVTPTSGGTATDQALVGYLTGSTTAIEAHDGTFLLSPGHQTTGYNRRLRRHYGHA